MMADVRRGEFDVSYDGAIHDNPDEYLERLRPGSAYNTGDYRSEAFRAALATAKLEPDPQVRSQRSRLATQSHGRSSEPLSLARQLDQRRQTTGNSSSGGGLPRSMRGLVSNGDSIVRGLGSQTTSSPSQRTVNANLREPSSDLRGSAA